MTVNLHPFSTRINIRFVLTVSLLAILLVMAVLATTARFGPVVGNVRLVPAIGLDQAQTQVSFAIPQPKWLPEGLVRQGSHVSPPDWAQTFYARAGGGEGGLGIEVTQGATHSLYVFPAAAKQSVTVNGQAAVCVQGSWNEKKQWMATADAVDLEWSANGFLYTIGGSGLGLNCNDLIKIGESLR
jgi:hypothetical protein